MRLADTLGALQVDVIDPLFDNNPISLQVLGICSALAVTTKMETALVMSIAVEWTSAPPTRTRSYSPDAM